jgi:uncharacterized membrane protein
MRALPRTIRTALALVLVAAAMTGFGSTVLAADSLTVTTPYPAIVVGPGSKVSFDLTVKTTAPARVNLAVSGTPTGWTATIRGGGFDIEAVQTNGKDATTASVDVTVPADATGSSTITLTASGLGQTVVLPLEVRVEASAAGDVTLTTDVPSQKGSSTSTFTFNLTLDNSTSQDLTFSVAAEGPAGWTVDAKLTGQTQAASAIVKAGSSSGVTVTANPPDGVTAGTYPIDVTATAGGKTYKLPVEIDITGSFKLTMSTPNQVLSTSGSAGSETDQQLVLTNGGTAPIHNITMAGTGATNWKITFDQPTIGVIEAGATATVTAKIVPTGDAIAGDYSLTFTATSDAATATQDIRFTVETSLQWAIVGIALIVLVAVGVWYVFQRYGRR